MSDHNTANEDADQPEFADRAGFSRRESLALLGAAGTFGLLSGCADPDKEPSPTLTASETHTPTTSTGVDTPTALGPTRSTVPPPSGSPSQTQAASTPRPPLKFRAQATWDMDDLFDASGYTVLRGFTDVSGDDTVDLVCNIGAAADFAAITQDNEVLWRQSIDRSKDKLAYFPQLITGEGCLVYGSRRTDTVYCLNITDGSIRWTYETNGRLQSLEQADIGVAVGSKGTNGEVIVLDYEDGRPLQGWPISFSQHEQKLGAGDLDDDGQDEFVVNNNSGTIEVRNRDASTVFAISSEHTHVDIHFIGDVNPATDGNELLTIIDDDDSVGAEGDEIVFYNKAGVQYESFKAPTGGVNMSVGNIRSDRAGLEVAYCLEGTGHVGLLDGTLNELWTTTVPMNGNGTSQLAVADIDGDGAVEILTNTGEHPDAGIIVLDSDGDRIAEQFGWGWDFDPLSTKRDAAVDSKRFVDLDGDGREEVHASRLGAIRQRGHEVVRLMELVPDPDTSTPMHPPEDSSVTLIDGFEDGDINEYQGSTDRYAVTTDQPVGEGTYSLKALDTGAAPLVSTTGLAAYPEAGDTIAAKVAQTDAHPFVGVAWGVQDTENFYWTRVDTNKDSLDILKMEDGDAERLGEVGYVLDDVGTVYRFIIDWSMDGTMTIEFQSANGYREAAITGHDTTFTGGGIGLRQGGMLDHIRFW